MIRSESSARATSAVAASASSMVAAPLPAARRPREEDHAVGVPGNLFERADHDRLTPALPAGDRHGRPQAGIELAPELLDQTLLVLGPLYVSFGDQNLSMARFHPQELHGPIMSEPCRRPALLTRSMRGFYAVWRRFPE